MSTVRGRENRNRPLWRRSIHLLLSSSVGDPNRPRCVCPGGTSSSLTRTLGMGTSGGPRLGCGGRRGRTGLGFSLS